MLKQVQETETAACDRTTWKERATIAQQPLTADSYLIWVT